MSYAVKVSILNGQIADSEFSEYGNSNRWKTSMICGLIS
jgi:hypothetical protein